MSGQNNRELEESIQRIAGTYGISFVKLIECTVVSVDRSKRICVANSSDAKINSDNFEVNLMPEISDGELDIPSKDSTIIVAYNDYIKPFVVSKTWIDEKEIIVGNQAWNIKDGKQVFNDGSYGGLIIIEKLIEKINNLEKQLNKMTQTWDSFCSSYVPGSPAFTGSPATLTSSLIKSTLTETKRDDIENKSITHGEKIES